MKKLSLLSLILFAALVSQSCKKLSSNIDEDLVPIVFSGAGITKTRASFTPNNPFDALVLGSKKSNDWTTIHTSNVYDYTNGDYVLTFARGKIELNTSNNPKFPSGAFDPGVYYPIISTEYIYIKALAPYLSIKDRVKIVGSKLTTMDPKVTFTVDGHSDIMASGETTRNPLPTADHSFYWGCGTRVKPTVKLKFERLLAKINFYIKVPNAVAKEAWGAFRSITFKGGHTEFEYDLSSCLPNLLELPSPTGDFTVPRAIVDKLIEEHPNEHKGDFACSVMVYPTDTWSIDISTVNQTRTNIEFPTALVKATEYDITLTFTETKGITVTKVSVIPWTTTDASTGDITGIQ